eukprot:COSAG04_NODE_697_length_11055_cov_5.640471_12_plen_192_part_00
MLGPVGAVLGALYKLYLADKIHKCLGKKDEQEFHAVDRDETDVEAGPQGVLIKGHPEPEYNGVYLHEQDHEGWPVYKTAEGMYCYRYGLEHMWYLSDSFDPDDDKPGCAARITSPEGPLPVGANAWEAWIQQRTRTKHREWKDCTLTVNLLVSHCSLNSLPGPGACPIWQTGSEFSWGRRGQISSESRRRQ